MRFSKDGRHSVKIKSSSNILVCAVFIHHCLDLLGAVFCDFDYIFD